MSMASSWTSGYNYRLINAGEIENNGIEIALNTRVIEKKDWFWDVNLNFSKNNNKVKELVDGMDMFELEKAPWLNVQVAAMVGEDFGAIVGPDFGIMGLDRRSLHYHRIQEPDTQRTLRCKGGCRPLLDVRTCILRIRKSSGNHRGS